VRRAKTQGHAEEHLDIGNHGTTSLRHVYSLAIRLLCFVGIGRWLDIEAHLAPCMQGVTTIGTKPKCVVDGLDLGDG
jgi:hypothetical protein